VPPLGRFAAGLALATAAGAATGALAVAGTAAVAPAGPAGAALTCAAAGIAVLAGYLPVLRLACPAEFALVGSLRGDLRRRRS
jgi:hypothetical protein